MKYDVVALGEILIDFTPCGKSEYGYPMYIQNPGGGPVNLAAAVAAFQGKSAFIGKVGNDAQGRFLTDCLARTGTDVSGVCVDRERNTTLAFVTLQDDGNRDFTFYRNQEADVRLSKEEVRYDIVENSAVFHFSSLSLTHEISREATLTAVAAAKKSGALISFDPNYRAALWTEREALGQIYPALGMADVAKFSMEEAEMICGTPDLKKCAEFFRGQGLQLFAVTLGGEGSVVFGKGFRLQIPAFTKGIVSVDSTGAGDIFWGAFLCRLAKDVPSPAKGLSNPIFLEKAFTFAACAAGLSTTKKGGVPSIPSHEEVLSAL